MRHGARPSKNNSEKSRLGSALTEFIIWDDCRGSILIKKPKVIK